MTRSKDNRDMSDIERSDRATIECLRAALKIASADIITLTDELRHYKGVVIRLVQKQKGAA